MISIIATWPLSLRKTKYNPNPQVKIILLQKISIIKIHLFIEYLQCARQHRML